LLGGPSAHAGNPTVTVVLSVATLCFETEGKRIRMKKEREIKWEKDIIKYEGRMENKSKIKRKRKDENERMKDKKMGRTGQN